MYFDETAWVAIAFVIFMGLVWRKASKAITGILDSRSLLIENELKEAKSLKEEALEELRKSLQSLINRCFLRSTIPLTITLLLYSIYTFHCDTIV